MLEMMEEGPSVVAHPDERLKGVRVLCCDATEKGHAFDGREAITVTLGNGKLNYCKGHCLSAFVTAFRTARSAGKASIRVPELGGSFTIQRKDGRPESDSQPPARAGCMITAERGRAAAGRRVAPLSCGCAGAVGFSRWRQVPLLG